MKYYRRIGQMDLTDRVAIETGLCKGESFKRIAKQIGRHPSTVAHEVLENRTYINQPFIRPIVRGKVKAPTEFGAMKVQSIGFPSLMK